VVTKAHRTTHGFFVKNVKLQTVLNAKVPKSLEVVVTGSDMIAE
jgi:hypothetical protein